MQFSIIVPVYNVENYLANTISSVLNQKFTDFELILVDDGSNDKSLIICDAFAKRDDRVNVLHKINGGVSSARNVGIKEASGEYLLFVDGDDLLEEDALGLLNEKIIESETKYDIIFAGHREFFDNSTKIENFNYFFDIKKIENCSQDDLFYYLFSELKGFSKAVWANAYRTKFVKANKLYFDEALTRNEDGDWCFKVLTAIESKTAINHSTYLYRRDNKNSVSNSKETFGNFKSSFIVYTRWDKFFKESFGENYSKKKMIAHIAEGYTNLGTYIYDINKNERQKAKDMFVSKIYILKCSGRKDHRTLLYIYIIFGLNPYLKLINFLRRLKCNIKKWQGDL